MACGTGNTAPTGLVAGHAYTLLGVQTITSGTGSVLARLYKVRNPWSSDVYTGKWSDFDTTNWTPSAQT